MVSLVIGICELPLSQYLSFTSLVNALWLNIVNVVVADPIIPVLVFLVVCFFNALEMSSISVTTFGGRLIGGGCVPGPVP